MDYHAPPQIGEPFDKESVLEYLALCLLQVAERVPQLNLEADSGFDWLPFSKLELQFYTIRHIQQHHVSASYYGEFSVFTPIS